MEGPGNPRAFTICSGFAAQSGADTSQKAKPMSHPFPPLRPPAAPSRKSGLRVQSAAGPTAADLCLFAALLLSLALALV